MAKSIQLAFLWHQHQPFYKDLRTGKAIMPWVRLHAAKDYYDMAAILDRYPEIRLTINLVPSLVEQLLDFADHQTPDPWLELTLTPASKLSDDQKCWILENFFYANWETMILAHKRYGELFEKRGRYSAPKDMSRIKSYFTVQDFLDL